MSVECPKCAYTRAPTDRAPAYECPRCGVVYEKYKGFLERTRKQDEPPITPDPTEEREDLSKLNEPISEIRLWLVEKRILLKERIGKFYIAGLFLCITVAILTYIFPSLNIFSEQGRLRLRYSAYLDELENLEPGMGYEYLSSSTKKVVSKETWISHRSESNLSNKEYFKSVSFSEDGMSAKVVSIVEVDGKNRLARTMTWINEQGKWYVDWAADNRDEAQIWQKEDQEKSNESAILSICWWEIGFKPIEFLDGYTHVKATPITSLVICNDGQIPISYLEIRLEYYDDEIEAVFSSIDRKVIYGGDSVIGVFGKSKKISKDSDTGLVSDMANIDAGKIAERTVRRIERRFYFKLSHDGKWKPLPAPSVLTNPWYSSG